MVLLKLSWIQADRQCTFRTYRIPGFASIENSNLMPASLYTSRCYANAGLPELIHLVRADDKKVLDIGCGAGDNALLLRARGHIVHGVTLSDAEREMSRPRMERVILADVETWEWDYEDGEFDALLFSHVLEHLVDPLATLRRLVQLVRPGGRVYIALPNVLFWRQRHAFLTGSFEYTDAGTLDRTHLRFFTYLTAQRLVIEAGLILIGTFSVGTAPLRPLRRVLPKAAASIDRLACRLWPNLFSHNVLLVGEKSKNSDV